MFINKKKKNLSRPWLRQKKRKKLKKEKKWSTILSNFLTPIKFHDLMLNPSALPKHQGKISSLIDPNSLQKLKIK
jgi:hypothetical protein